MKNNKEKREVERWRKRYFTFLFIVARIHNTTSSTIIKH